jgi:CheY-like chemotaxis protein
MAARILIADDDDSIRRLIATNLLAAGYEVIAAKDGKEACALFEKEAPDVVLLDVMMPGMDGFAACDAIRQLPNGANVPVAFLTAHGDARTVSLEHGPNDFMTKPMSRVDLLERVANLVRIKEIAEKMR